MICVGGLVVEMRGLVRMMMGVVMMLMMVVVVMMMMMLIFVRLASIRFEEPRVHAHKGRCAYYNEGAPTWPQDGRVYAHRGDGLTIYDDG